MSAGFFLNVALGASLGPTAVAVASEYVFGGSGAALGPALALTVAGGYFVAIIALVAALVIFRARSAAAH